MAGETAGRPGAVRLFIHHHSSISPPIITQQEVSYLQNILDHDVNYPDSELDWLSLNTFIMAYHPFLDVFDIRDRAPVLS